MSNVYAMRRANGDWFALDEHGDYRVPLFQSSRHAMQARASNLTMLLFQPVRLDEISLGQLAVGRERNSHFWLVDDAVSNVKRGRRFEHAQLVQLVRDYK